MVESIGTIYTVGGTVQAGAGLYLHRRADQELLDLCRKGTFAYVLAARQMGKSSLMVRTAERLAEEGVRTAIIDVTEFGSHVTAEEWYLGLFTRISARLRLKTDTVTWWNANRHLGFANRMVLFFQEVLLSEVAEPAVIFVDEIDSTLGLGFTDDFFAAIRSLYNARALQPELRRLSFVLLGVAAPSNLINDPRRTPFNIGQPVDLADFTYDEALPLADGLGLPAREARQVLGWILQHTGGHPYLTQRICAYLTRQRLDGCTEADLDRTVSDLFYGDMSDRDNNLQFVRDMLTRKVPGTDQASVLATYRQVRQGRHPVPYEEQSLVQSHLMLSGILVRQGNLLRVRNPIYATVFDLEWIQEHWAVSWWDSIPPGIKIAAGIVVVMLVALIFTSGFAIRAQQNAAAERDRANENARVATSLGLAAKSNSLFDGPLDLALLLGVEAHRLGDNVESRSNLLNSMLSVPWISTFLTGHTNQVYSVAFSPDGQTLASASRDNTIILWDLADAAHPVQLGPPLTGHTDEVFSVAFSPDGQTLASASRDNTIILWDLADPANPVQLGQPLTGHHEWVYAVAFNSDGQTLASASADNTAIIWELADRDNPVQMGKPLAAHTDDVYSVAFSPDGQTLASASYDHTILLWDLTDPANPIQLGPPLTAHTDLVYSVAFSPDGQTLASASNDQTIILWDLADPANPIQLGQPLAAHTDQVRSVAFSPDGQVIASGSKDNTIILWDLTDNSHPIQMSPPLTAHTGRVRIVAFSPDGQTLASASDDRTVILWDLAASGKPNPLGHSLTAHTDWVNSVAFSPDGQTLASGSDDQTIILWDLADPANRVQLGQPLTAHTDKVRIVEFSPDGRTLASGGADNTTILWDLADPANPKQLGQPLTGHTDEVRGVPFRPDGRILATASEDRTIVLWDLADPAHPAQFGQPLTGQNEEVRGSAFSPDGQTLASSSCGDDDYSGVCTRGEIILWDLTDPALPVQLSQTRTGHNEWVYTVAFSPDGRILASGGEDQTVILWDLADPSQPVQLGQPLTGHTNRVNSVAFSPDGQTLASASADQTIILWDLADPANPIQLGQPLTGHTMTVRGVAFSPDGQTMASASGDQSVIVWDVSLEAWKARACRIANRNLTQREWKRYLPNEPYRETCPHLPPGT
jgi:WD40 repeat protein